MNTFEVFLQGISTGEIKMGKIFDRNLLNIVKDFLTPRCITFKNRANDFQIQTYADEKFLYVLRDKSIYTFYQQKLEKITPLKTKIKWPNCFTIFDNKIFVSEDNHNILTIFDMDGTQLHAIDFDEYIACFMVNSRGIFICSDSHIDDYVSEYDHKYNLIRTFYGLTPRRVSSLCFSEYYKKFYVLHDGNITDIFDEDGTYLKTKYDMEEFGGDCMRIFAYKNFIVCLADLFNTFIKIYDGDMENIGIENLGFKNLGQTPNSFYLCYYMAENSDIYVSHNGEKIWIFKGWI